MIVYTVQSKTKDDNCLLPVNGVYTSINSAIEVVLLLIKKRMKKYNGENLDNNLVNNFISKIKKSLESDSESILELNLNSMEFINDPDRYLYGEEEYNATDSFLITKLTADYYYYD